MILLVLATGACATRSVVTTAARPVPPEVLAQLWVDPGDEPRDLFWGPGGEALAPAPDTLFTFDGKDERGFSVSYDVTDPEGLEWSAKIGPEAQTEVVVSRLLWGIGYQQPPTYFLPSWRLAEPKRETRERSARFRPKLDRLDALDEPWSWADNPFSGTQPFKGLLVVLLMFNSTDLKDDNNTIYELEEPWFGARRWFVVRDLGASLGETGRFYPRRNWVRGFERHGFIKRVHEDGRVEFEFRGRHRELLAMIRVPDVQWAARLMQRLTDQQWTDAFRAARYAPPLADRYIARIRQKVAEGLALPRVLHADTTATP